MRINPFISTEVGDIPLKNHNAIKTKEKLRLVITPQDLDDEKSSVASVEVLNPLQRRVVISKLPEMDLSKLVYFDVVIPDNWINGNYTANVLDISNRVVCKCYFTLFVNDSLQTYITERTLTPKWRIHYRLKVKNPTTKPIGNFSAFVALPITIAPQQITKELVIQPENQKISTDVEGNKWTHFEFKAINPLVEKEMGFSALVECRPLVFSKESTKNYKTNPYSKKFLKKYLDPEPHIESDHPKIRELAAKISNKDPIAFAKKAANIVNRTIKYQIQPGEYGAAFAVEKGVGDCTEFAALFVALCRAEGIPARTNGGFTLAQQWERHATAEFLVSGRWIPIDVTGHSGSDLFIGILPTNIIITRGNWMGGTLAKEVSYRYQIIEQTQKLDVNIEWKINFEYGTAVKRTHKKSTPDVKTIKILEPKISETSKIKILNEESIEKRLTSDKQDRISLQKETIRLKKSDIIKIQNKGTSKAITIDITFPDVVKAGHIQNQPVTIRNKTESVQTGSFEIRLLENGIVKLLSIKGVKIPSNSSLKFKPNIIIDKTGSHILEFVLLNRIGRTLVKVEKTVSVY